MIVLGAAGAGARRALTTVSTRRLPFMHSLLATPRYAILVMPPLYWDLGKLLAAQPVLESMHWVPTDPTVVLVIDLADAIFANDYGADASDVGLREVVAEQRAWRHGEKYLVLKGACLQDAMAAVAVGAAAGAGSSDEAAADEHAGGRGARGAARGAQVDFGAADAAADEGRDPKGRRPRDPAEG